MRMGIKIAIGIGVVVLLLFGLATLFMPSLSRARELSSATAARMRARAGGFEAPAGPLPGADEELWVIQRPRTWDADEKTDVPGCGTLKALVPGGVVAVPLPLEHTDVQASVTGYIATVHVTQEYHNPYDQKIEAVYVFPLPQNAAVNEFVMTLGDRCIRGVIREREEAEAIYEQAKRQGHVVSLMTQERPNIFTQSVANIEPGRRIDLDIKYFHTLPFDDGWYEFVFPMVVGPRFNPPGTTRGVGPVARGKGGLSGQATEVQYLRPGERSGHDISLAVSIDAGVSIEEVTCPSHVVTVERPEVNHARVVLSPLDAIPNKDFVVRYRVAGNRTKTALMMQPGVDGSYFTLMLHPPHTLSSLSRAPMEMIFVLDCSGSMSGRPIEQAKKAIERALRQLQPDDTFQVIRFSNSASQLGPAPVLATKKSVLEGIDYVRSLVGSGGTMMIEGIKAALDFPHDPKRLRVVTFLTDGFIGDELEILGEVHDRLGASRIFSFGVGSSPNRYLLDRMAKLGKGAVAYLGLNDNAGQVMDRFFARISHPGMTDIEIDWGESEVRDVFPERIPDLFVGRPVVVTGRLISRGESAVRFRGRVGEYGHEIRVLIGPEAESVEHEGIAPVWARKKIADLHDKSAWVADGSIAEKIKTIALAHNLISDYTAFVSVNASTHTDGDQATTVRVAVPVPDGVKYETTVQE